MAYNGNIIEPASSSEIVLRSLAIKTSAGGELTGAEVLMGMNATVVQNGNRFGPGPGDMPIAAPTIPESLKGAIAAAKI